MEKLCLKVTGMSCGHCERNLTNAMEDIGVAVTKVSSKDGIVEFEYKSDKITLDEIKTEIIELGYGVE